jgi:hypothetical protein
MKDLNKVSDSKLIRMMIGIYGRQDKNHFLYDLGDGKRNYTLQQKKYALARINRDGIRATSRILEVPRRTLQRWARYYGVNVRRSEYSFLGRLWL